MAAIDVLYEEGPCLVVNKPSGLLTQAARGIDSLEIWVQEFYRQRDSIEGKFYLGLIHRLDRPVSGAIAFGRNLRATQRLAKQFQERQVSKTYWAAVEGHVEHDSGTWVDHLHKRHGMSQSIVVPEDDERGKRAVLHYQVRERAEVAGQPYTWIEIELETGRTHQIRVQAASRGHSVLGDSQYGSQVAFGPETPELRDRAIALHARELGFRHPMQDLSVQVVAPLPAYWKPLEAIFETAS